MPGGVRPLLGCGPGAGVEGTGSQTPLGAQGWVPAMQAPVQLPGPAQGRAPLAAGPQEAGAAAGLPAGGKRLLRAVWGELCAVFSRGAGALSSGEGVMGAVGGVAHRAVPLPGGFCFLRSSRRGRGLARLRGRGTGGSPVSLGPLLPQDPEQLLEGGLPARPGGSLPTWGRWPSGPRVFAGGRGCPVHYGKFSTFPTKVSR